MLSWMASISSMLIVAPSYPSDFCSVALAPRLPIGILLVRPPRGSILRSLLTCDGRRILSKLRYTGRHLSRI